MLGVRRAARLCVLSLAVFAALGCTDSPSVVYREGEPPVVGVEAEDPAMSTAIQSARATFDGFVEQLPRLLEAGAYFSVKVPIQVGSDREHIWLDSPVVQGGQVRGQLGNEPLAGPYRLGDVVSVRVEEISDWMAVFEGELYGGYSLLLLRSRMSDAEQHEFDQSVGFHLPTTARPF